MSIDETHEYIYESIKQEIECQKRIREYQESTYDEKLVQEFKELLDDSSKNENDIQKYLENHTMLIPTPHILNHGLHYNFFISKLPLGQKYKTDFVYLTKSSDSWWIVLMELENQHKKMFKGNRKHAEFSDDFHSAFQQIKDWRNYLTDNKGEFLKSTDRLRHPLHENKVYFKYVLVIGRNKEKDTFEQRRSALAQEEDYFKDLRIITYDTLLSYYKQSRRLPLESIVVSPYQGDRFAIKRLPASEISTPAFEYLKPDDLHISSSDIEKFKAEDYEIDKWLDGKQLAYNEKYTAEGLAAKIKNPLIKSILI